MAHHSFDPSDIFIKRSHQMPGLRTDPRTYPDTLMKKILDVKKFTIYNCIGSTKSSVSSFHFTLVKNRFLSDKWLYFGIHRPSRPSVWPCDRWPSRESLAWVRQQNRFQFYLDLIMFEIFLEHGYHYRPYKRFRLWRDSKLNFLNHFWTWSEVR